MKTRSASITLVLLLTLGVITVVSFSLGCTEQEETSAEPSNNTTPAEANQLSVNASAELTEEPSAETTDIPDESATIPAGSSGSSESTESPAEELEPISVDNITNIEWQWTSFQDADSPDNPVVVPSPENYTITFSADGTFSFKADCSNGSGTYSLEGNDLLLTLPVTTIADCGIESMNGEYLSLLPTVEKATIEDGKLVLFSGIEGDKMFLVNGGEAEQ
jgi:heat shock protein HslJ